MGGVLSQKRGVMTGVCVPKNDKYERGRMIATSKD